MKAGKPADDAGFAVPCGAVQKNRFLRDERRSQLVHEPVGQHQVRKGRLQQSVVDGEPDVLVADSGGVSGSRHRGRADVMAGEVSFGDLFTADPRQGERVVVAVHPGDLEELLLAQALEQGVQQREGQLDGSSQLPQGGCSFGVNMAEHQVLNHGLGYVQFTRCPAYPGRCAMPIVCYRQLDYRS